MVKNAPRLKKYPTAVEIQRMSLQELMDRGLIALASGSFGAVDNR